MDVQNRGAGTVTITPTTSTIDGAASIALTQNQGIRVVSDGTNYFTMRGIGGSGAVSSVAGKTGVVTLVGSDITSCRATGQGTGTVTIAACTITRGNNPVAQFAAATIALSGTPANETCKVYITATDSIVAECVTSTGRTCTNCNVVTSATPSFPEGSTPLATITNTSTSWTTVTDQVPDMNLYTVEAGDGLDCATTGGITTCSVDGTNVRTTGTNTLLGTYDFTGATVSGVSTSQITRTQYFPVTGQSSAGTSALVSGWFFPSANPSTITTAGLGGNDRTGVMQFADGAADLSATLHFRLPSTWVAPIDLQIPYSITTGGTNFRLVVHTMCRGVGQTINGGTFIANTAQVVATSAGNLATLSMSALDVSTCSAGELFFMKVERTPTHASDDATGTLNVYGAELKIRETQ
jgi:hypothetical protein